MPSSKPPPTPASAPDLIGPTSILSPPVSGPRSARRARDRPYAHAHYEVDLAPSQKKTASGSSVMGKIGGLLHERQVAESEAMTDLSGATLHALSARGFHWVDDWEFIPGGRVALPETRTNKSRQREPVGNLLRALENGTWASVSQARSVDLRLSDLAGNRAEVTVRRVHREREHALSVDLRGKWTRLALHELTGSLSNRLPVQRITLTKFQYA